MFTKRAVLFLTTLMILTLSSCQSTSGQITNTVDESAVLQRLADNHQLIMSGEAASFEPALLDQLIIAKGQIPSLDESESYTDQFSTLLETYTKLNDIFQLFAQQRNQQFDSESAKLFSVISYMNVRLLDTGKLMLSDLDENNFVYDTRKNGLTQASVGVSNMLIGGIGEAFVLTPESESSAIIKEHMYDYGPEVMRALDQEFREQIMSVLEKQIEPEVSEQQHQSFEEMLARIQDFK